jgi:hypothetical protein
LLLAIRVPSYFFLRGHLRRLFCRLLMIREHWSRRGREVLFGGQGQRRELCRQLFKVTSQWLDRELVDAAIADEVV